MSETFSFRREIPVEINCDVCVAGGGPAGVAAAVAAARGGAEVFLAEAHSCFGGMGTAGLVPGFCAFDDGINEVAAGIGTEVLRKLAPEVPLHINAEKLKRVYDDLIITAGVRFRLLTVLVGCESENGRIKLAVFHGKSGFFAVRAAVFIDATGDGDLSVMAGAPSHCLHGDGMPGSCCSRWGNVDFRKYEAGGKEARDYLPAAFADGVFRKNDPHHPGMWELADHLSGGNFGHLFNLDATDTDSLSAALPEGRKQMEEFREFYRKYVPGFENAVLLETASLPGVRESRIIEGEYTLTLEDFVRRADFPDEIGRYCYSIDLHQNNTSKEAYAEFFRDHHQYRYRPGESYGIPYRILLPKNTANLLCAGRCVSTDRYMLSSLRVMPGCFLTGQAAGAAAAIAVSRQLELRAIAPELLQNAIRALGGKAGEHFTTPPEA